MLIDYHTHHERCGHAIGQVREYIEQGIKVGLDEIGISDHMPVIHLHENKIPTGVAMQLHELEAYVQEVLDLKHEYKNEISVKIGLEADYVQGYEEQIAKLLSPYPFDYLIGSVHFLGDWDFSDSRQMHGWKQKSVDEIFTEYFLTVQAAAKSGLYDIIGHFDVVKKFGHIPQNDIASVIENTLTVIKQTDTAMEVNTSGLFKIVKEIYPAPSIIKLAVNMGVPFTLGSDAHKPEHVHIGVEEGRKVLQELGVTRIATFTQRKRNMVAM